MARGRDPAVHNRHGTVFCARSGTMVRCRDGTRTRARDGTVVHIPVCRTGRGDDTAIKTRHGPGSRKAVAAQPVQKPEGERYAPERGEKVAGEQLQRTKIRYVWQAGMKKNAVALCELCGKKYLNTEDTKKAQRTTKNRNEKRINSVTLCENLCELCGKKN